MNTVLRAYEVDIDGLAESLHTLADAIDDREIPVKQLSTGVDVEADDDVIATISVDYVVAEGYEHLHEIEYDHEGGDAA
jgi:hypothetical protein